MTRARSLTIPFDDFTGGHWGLLDGSKASKGQWYGTNVMLYPSGMLGPRPGLKYHGVVGSPTTGSLAGYSLGPKGLFYAVAQGGGITLYRVAGLDTGVFALTFLGGWAGPSSVYWDFTREDGIDYAYVANAGTSGRLHRVNLGTNVGADITVPFVPGGRILRWGERMVTMSKEAEGNRRLWYSAAADYTSWPVENNLFVGDDDDIEYLGVLGNNLYVGKRTGWWQVSGVLGDSTVVRQVSTIGLVDSAHSTENGILFTRPKVIAGTVRTQVHAMTGGAVTPLFEVDTVATRMVALHTGGFVLSGNTQTLWAMSEGVLARHVLADIVSDETRFVNPRMPYMDPRPMTLWGVDGDNNFTPVSIDLGLNRPALSTDLMAGHGDGSSTTPNEASFDLTEWWNPRGVPMRVRAIIVQLRTWDTGFTGSNRFSIVARSLGGYDTGTSDTPKQWFTQDASASTSSGVDTSVRFTFDADWGNGFQVKIADIERGIAFRRFDVIVDELDDQRVP